MLPRNAGLPNQFTRPHHELSLPGKAEKRVNRSFNSSVSNPALLNTCPQTQARAGPASNSLKKRRYLAVQQGQTGTARQQESNAGCQGLPPCKRGVFRRSTRSPGSASSPGSGRRPGASRGQAAPAPPLPSRQTQAASNAVLYPPPRLATDTQKCRSGTCPHNNNGKQAYSRLRPPLHYDALI